MTTATRTHAPVEPIDDLVPRRRPRGMVARRTRAVAIKTNSLSAAFRTLHHEVENHLHICRRTPSHDAVACYGNLIAQQVYLSRCADLATTAVELIDQANDVTATVQRKRHGTTRHVTARSMDDHLDHLERTIVALNTVLNNLTVLTDRLDEEG